MYGAVFCKKCGCWVFPIYGGECSNCGEDIPDYEEEKVIESESDEDDLDEDDYEDENELDEW